MNRRLYLHIGVHKTGSTAIQRFLYAQRALLAERGILYPEVALRGTGHHEIPFLLRGEPKDADCARLASWFEAIAARAGDARDIHTVILSSDEFEFATRLADLDLLARDFDIKVIAYLRKQDQFLESVYNQHVKAVDLRFSGSIYQFALRHNFFRRFDYPALLGRWEQQFGRQNIVVRPYGTTAVEADTRLDFLGQVKVDDPGLLALARNSGPENVSVPAAVLPYLARANTLELTRAEHRQVLNRLCECVPPVRSGRLLTSEEAADFYRKFSAGNREVARRYLGLDADLFDSLREAATPDTYIDHFHIDRKLLLAVLQQALPPQRHAGLAQLGGELPEPASGLP